MEELIFNKILTLHPANAMETKFLGNSFHGMYLLFRNSYFFERVASTMHSFYTEPMRGGGETVFNNFREEEGAKKHFWRSGLMQSDVNF